MRDSGAIELLKLLLDGTSPAEKKDSVKFFKSMVMKMKVPNDLNLNWIRKLAQQKPFENYCRHFAKHLADRYGFPEDVQNEINELKNEEPKPEIRSQMSGLLKKGILEALQKHPEASEEQKMNYVIGVLVHNLKFYSLSGISVYRLPHSPLYAKTAEALLEALTNLLLLPESLKTDDEAGAEKEDAAPDTEPAPAEEVKKSSEAPAEPRKAAPAPEAKPKAKSTATTKAEFAAAKAEFEKLNFSEAAVKPEEIKRPEPRANTLNVVTGLLIAFGNSFYNFYPICRWKKGYPVAISREAAAELYPEKCNIVFSDPQNLNRTQRSILKEGALLNIEFDDEELEENPSGNLSRKVLDIAQLFRENRVHPACYDDRENGYWKAFYVAEPAEREIVNFDDRHLAVKIDSSPRIRQELAGIVGQPVLVRHQNRFYGPFTLREDSADNLYVNAQGQSHSGFTDYYEVLERGELTPLVDITTLSFWVKQDIFFINPRMTKKFRIDTISPETLVREITRKLPDNTDFTEAMTEWLGVHLKDGQFSSQILTRNRVLRLLEYLVKAAGERRDIDTFVGILDKILVMTSYQNKDLFTTIYSRALDDGEVIRRLPSHKLALEKLEELKKELIKLEKDTDSLNEKKREQELKVTKNKEILELEKKIRTLAERHADLVTLDGLIQAIDKKKEERAAVSAELRQSREELEKLKAERSAFNKQLDNFDRKIHETAANVANLAFDGEVTAKILAAANRWDARKNEERYEKRIGFLRGLTKNEARDRQLNQDLITYLSAFRPYEKNEFTNLFVCVAQNFLTVLSGQPGSGKTSLCNLLAGALGLTGIAREPGTAELWDQNRILANRYIPVSVERGWTSKRDLIGYFNPLTHSFESPDPHRLECFRELDAEAKAGFNELPYFVLLDEANLSSMEYYFADFMNICDERNELSYISLGGNLSYRIPDTLRFLATINNDHTTENLSPRLIDRAWIITLPRTKPMDSSGAARENRPDALPPMNWQKFLATYGAEGRPEMSPGLKLLLKDAVSQFEDLQVQVSPRSLGSIQNYIRSAARLMDSISDETNEMVAFDFAVAQKLLPTINGAGTDYKEKLLNLSEWLKNSGLKKSVGLLDDIVKRGEANMDYYGFF
jgi:hypothetical protein